MGEWIVNWDWGLSCGYGLKPCWRMGRGSPFLRKSMWGPKGGGEDGGNWGESRGMGMRGVEKQGIGGHGVGKRLLGIGPELLPLPRPTKTRGLLLHNPQFLGLWRPNERGIMIHFPPAAKAAVMGKSAVWGSQIGLSLSGRAGDLESTLGWSSLLSGSGAQKGQPPSHGHSSREVPFLVPLDSSCTFSGEQADRGELWACLNLPGRCVSQAHPAWRLRAR